MTILQLTENGVIATTNLLTDSPFTNGIAWDSIEIGGKRWPPNEGSVIKFDIRGAKRAYKWDIKDGMGIEGWQSWYRGWTGPTFTITFYIWTTEQYDDWLDFSQVFLYDASKRPAQTASALTDANKRAAAAGVTLANLYAQRLFATGAAAQALDIQIRLAKEAVAIASGQAAKAAAVGNVPSPGVRALVIKHPQLSSVNIHQVVCEDIQPPEKQSDDLMFSAVVTLREFRQPPIVNATSSPDAAADSPEGDPDSPDIVSRQNLAKGLYQTVVNGGIL